MKKLKLFSILFIGILSFNLSYAQKPTKAEKKAAKTAQVSKLITSKNYVFKATYAIPMSLAPRNLNTDYDVTVTKDNLVIYLPYFGRVFSAPRNLTDGGLKLTTTKFDYKEKANKNNSWEIIIKPKENSISGVKDVQQLTLNVSNDGYATLRVTCLDKQPISYNGYIEEVKKG